MLILLSSYKSYGRNNTNVPLVGLINDSVISFGSLHGTIKTPPLGSLASTRQRAKEWSCGMRFTLSWSFWRRVMGKRARRHRAIFFSAACCSGSVVLSVWGKFHRFITTDRMGRKKKKQMKPWCWYPLRFFIGCVTFSPHGRRRGWNRLHCLNSAGPP